MTTGPKGPKLTYASAMKEKPRAPPCAASHGFTVRTSQSLFVPRAIVGWMSQNKFGIAVRSPYAYPTPCSNGRVDGTSVIECAIVAIELPGGDLLGVIDADLQHPPEILVALANALRQSNADLAVSSRYMAGGGTSDWEFIRRVISGGATHLAA